MRISLDIFLSPSKKPSNVSDVIFKKFCATFRGEKYLEFLIIENALFDVRDYIRTCNIASLHRRVGYAKAMAYVGLVC